MANQVSFASPYYQSSLFIIIYFYFLLYLCPLSLFIVGLKAETNYQQQKLRQSEQGREREKAEHHGCCHGKNQQTEYIYLQL